MPEGRFWHVTFHPARRSPALWDEIEVLFLELVNELASRLGFAVLAVSAMPDHVHLLIELPPWLDLVQVIGRVKGYTAYRILRRVPDLRVDMRSHGFWARGYHYVRHTEATLPVVLDYIRDQKTKGGLEEGPLPEAPG